MDIAAKELDVFSTPHLGWTNKEKLGFGVMRFGVIALACALSIVGASSASAANHGWYASIEAGTESTGAWSFIAIGHHFGDNISVELAAGGTIDDNSFDQRLVLLNVNLTYPITDALSLVGGAGAGLDYIDYGYSDTVFAYQLFFGLDYELSDSTKLYARYRSVTAQDVLRDWWSGEYENATNGLVTVGVRFDL